MATTSFRGRRPQYIESSPCYSVPIIHSSNFSTLSTRRYVKWPMKRALELARSGNRPGLLSNDWRVIRRLSEIYLLSAGRSANVVSLALPCAASVNRHVLRVRCAAMEYR